MLDLASQRAVIYFIDSPPNQPYDERDAGISRVAVASGSEPYCVLVQRRHLLQIVPFSRGTGTVRVALSVATIGCAIALPLAVITSVVLGLMFDASYFQAGQRR